MNLKASEANIQSAIIDYLCARRILAFRMNTGAMATEHKGRKRIIRFGVVGMSDLICWPRPDMTLWIEVKSQTGRQRPEQASFQKIVEDNGHCYLLARSVDDVIEYLSTKQTVTAKEAAVHGN